MIMCTFARECMAKMYESTAALELTLGEFVFEPRVLWTIRSPTLTLVPIRTRHNRPSYANGNSFRSCHGRCFAGAESALPGRVLLFEPFGSFKANAFLIISASSLSCSYLEILVRFVHNFCQPYSERTISAHHRFPTPVNTASRMER